MPSSQEHLDQARHNYGLIEDLVRTDILGKYPDWVVTICFYSAVHYVEAGIAGSKFLSVKKTNQNTRVQNPRCSQDLAKAAGFTTSQHHARVLVLEWNGTSFPGCHEPYSELLELSMSARYNAQKVPLEDAQLALESAEKIRKVVESFIEKLAVEA